ncbi:trigger factor [Larsenimonas salina]|uniref:trigger factor n=1 Tax=Larsenimonas salina TaxID=1295565 RepID=UPI0020742603|nr:trigger factor [Larsenimonas salina]MCM5703773.1 trigger factor [Larsenimonas salina]
MQVSVETTSPIERRVTVQVPASQVDQTVDERLKETAQKTKLNGFRPGKVPMSVVRQRFGKDVRNEVVSELIRQHYVSALSEKELNPAGYPSIEPTVDEAGKDLEFVATFEVYPEIELKSIEGTEVERPKADITGADVDEMIETLRKQNAKWTSVDRPAQSGDQVKIDFEGFIDGEAFEGGKAEGHELVLGSESFIPGFEAQLEGAKAGDETEVTVNFPEDYQAEHLAGKEAVFKVVVHEVSEQSLPEVDAEFTKKFGIESGDLDEFKADVRANMERELSNAVDNSVKQQVMAALKKANDVTVPKTLVQQECQTVKRQAAQQFGLGEDFDVSQLPDELFEEQARDRVVVGLLLAEVVSANEIDANDDEIRDYIREYSGQYEEPEQLVEHYMNDEQLKNQVKSAVLEKKAVDQLLAQATVNDVEMSYQEALQAAQQQVSEDSEEAQEESSETA